MDAYTSKFGANVNAVLDGAGLAADRLADLIAEQAGEPDEDDWEEYEDACTSHEDLVEALRLARGQLLTACLWLERAKSFAPMPPHSPKK